MRWRQLGLAVLGVCVAASVTAAGGLPAKPKPKKPKPAPVPSSIEIAGHVDMHSYAGCINPGPCGDLLYDSSVVVKPTFDSAGAATAPGTATVHVENHLHLTRIGIVSGRETPFDCDRVDDVTIPVVVTLARTKTTITVTVKPTDAPLPEREVCGESLDAVGNLTLPASQEISMESPPLTVDNRTAATADTVVTLDGNSYPFGSYVPLSFSGTETGRWRVTVQHA